jgi:hypothetical protein
MLLAGWMRFGVALFADEAASPLPLFLFWEFDPVSKLAVLI